LIVLHRNFGSRKDINARRGTRTNSFLKSKITLKLLFFSSNVYAPTSRSGAYDASGTARRNLQNGYQNGTSALSTATQFLSNIRSQLEDGYTAVRDRVTNFIGQQQGSLTNSPSRGTTSGGTRFTRTSSQSSGSGGRTKGYNLRSRPVHSTPRGGDVDHDQRKTTSKYRKDNPNQGEIDEEEDYDDGDEDHQDNKHKRSKLYNNKVVKYLKKFLHSPIDIFDTVWDKLKGLPWWLLIPLLLILGLYACK
jgi:hypothetical protein